MDRSEISAIFRRVYGSNQNFMTPKVMDYGQRGRFVWELSSGRGMSNQPIYGVTIIEVDGSRRLDLSRMFPSEHAARKYIRDDFMVK